MVRARMVVAIVLVTMLAVSVAACGGGDDPVGVYKWVSGEESVKALTLELKDDGTFILSGDSEIAGNVSIQGDYKVDGDKVTLSMAGDDGTSESDPGTYKDGKLVFEEVTWQKE